MIRRIWRRLRQQDRVEELERSRDEYREGYRIFEDKAGDLQDRVEELEQYRARTEFILAGLRTVLDTTPEQVDRLARLAGQPETVDRLSAILDEEDR